MFPSQAPTVTFSNYQRRELLDIYASLILTPRGALKEIFFLFLKLLRFLGCDALTRRERDPTFEAVILAWLQANEVPTGA